MVEACYINTASLPTRPPSFHPAPTQKLPLPTSIPLLLHCKCILQYTQCLSVLMSELCHVQIPISHLNFQNIFIELHLLQYIVYHSAHHQNNMLHCFLYFIALVHTYTEEVVYRNKPINSPESKKKIPPVLSNHNSSI